MVSTHSRPKAAGLSISLIADPCEVSTHSRPKAAGAQDGYYLRPDEFQHTAARRRLGLETALI